MFPILQHSPASSAEEQRQSPVTLRLPGGLVARRQSLANTPRSAVTWTVAASGMDAVTAWLNQTERGVVPVTVITLQSGASAESLGLSGDVVLIITNRGDHFVINLTRTIMPYSGMVVMELPGVIGDSNTCGHRSQTQLIDTLKNMHIVMTRQKSLSHKPPIVMFAISGLVNGYVVDDLSQLLTVAIHPQEFAQIRQLSTAVQAVRVRDVNTGWLFSIAAAHTVKYSSLWLARAICAEKADSSADFSVEIDCRWEAYLKDLTSAAMKEQHTPVSTLVQDFRRKIYGGLKADAILMTLKWNLEKFHRNTELSRTNSLSSLDVYQQLLTAAVQEATVAGANDFDSFTTAVRVSFVEKGKASRLVPDVARTVYTDWLSGQRKSFDTQRTLSLDNLDPKPNDLTVAVGNERDTTASTRTVGGCCVIS